MNTSLIKSCSFFGHSKLNEKDNLEKMLFNEIERLIVEKGFNLFYFGGFGEFDALCYQVVSQLKSKYTHIKRVFCLIDEKQKNFSKRPKWLQKEVYEDFVYFHLSFDYWYTRIYFRNCQIINASDMVIFYVVNKERSGAHKALVHAINNKKDYINLGEK